MSTPFFKNVDKIKYEGPESENPFAFRYYDADREVMGKPMREWLRFAVCYWHSFCWNGFDIFGEGTFDRPWQKDGDPMDMAKMKMQAAFEFFEKLGVPFFTFHDVDVAPAGKTFKESCDNLSKMAELIQAEMERINIGLLWGTANLFSNKRYAAGASTNPDPEMFAYAAAQVKHIMEITKQLGGHNYVLWGGREGYDTLLNTDLKREGEQLGRFLTMVAEHKHKIGFKGPLLIEPKPCEPTKHQYDYDTATVYGFLKQFGLENEYKVNIEVNHATLSGHSFQHEIATAVAKGVFGSVDANRGDPQNGWDTDQFPNDVTEATLANYEILRDGGFKTGGFNFDTKLRRQSMDLEDLFHGHICGMDTMARGLLNAAGMIEDGKLQAHVDERYKGWDGDLGKKILSGQSSLDDLSKYVIDNNLQPEPVSGRQEYLENFVNRYI
jgi:xylose isomerase